MNQISLQSVMPNIFSDAGEIESGIWNTNIDFDKGHSYLIEASSGKGKSTLCSYIYGYRNDYTGNVCFDNNDIRSIKQKKAWDTIRTKELSLLFQELALFPELTALENVLLKNNLTHYKNIRQIEEMFDRLDIADKKNKIIAQTSWGQQQRVAIIRCLCQPFHFLLLDEPISHLDNQNAKIAADLIQEEASRQGAGIIATSIGKHLPLDYTKTVAL